MPPTVLYDTTLYHVTPILLICLLITCGVLEFISEKRSASLRSPGGLDYTRSPRWIFVEWGFSLGLNLAIVILFFHPSEKYLLILIVCFNRCLVTLQVIRANLAQFLIAENSLVALAFNAFFAFTTLFTVVLAALILQGTSTSYFVAESALVIVLVEGYTLNILYIRRYVGLRHRTTVSAIELLLSIVTMTILYVGVVVLIPMNALFSMDIVSIWVYTLLLSLGFVRAVLCEFWEIWATPRTYTVEVGRNNETI